MRRDVVSLGLVVLLLGAFGLFAWLTRQPDAPIFDRLSRWPVLGPAVADLQDRYRPQAAGTERLTEAVGLRSGRMPSETARDELELVIIGLGSLVRAEPTADARVLEKTRLLRRLMPVERQGSWVHVVLKESGTSGWVDLDAPRDPKPPLGEAPTPPLPLAAAPIDPEHLALAESLLGATALRGRLGPYELLTDVDEREWLRSLTEISTRLDAAYEERYGVQPIGSPAETVIVFARLEDYLRFRAAFERLGGIDSNGHATRGLAALHRERPRDEVSVTLVHELVHLLNRRALGPALPPWLDEGLADELSQLGALAGAGIETVAQAESAAGRRSGDGDMVALSGPLAALDKLRDAHRAGQLPTIETMVGLDWHGFVRASDNRLYYAQSTYWIHFLMTRDDALRLGFRTFLAGVARGDSPDGETLRGHLDMSWEALEADFRAWILVKAAAAGLS